jgi:hypothetical protein
MKAVTTLVERPQSKNRDPELEKDEVKVPIALDEYFFQRRVEHVFVGIPILDRANILAETSSSNNIQGSSGDPRNHIRHYTITVTSISGNTLFGLLHGGQASILGFGE